MPRTCPRSTLAKILGWSQRLLASPNIFNSITSLLNKLAPKPAIDYDKDECIVFSENFEELQAC